MTNWRQKTWLKIVALTIAGVFLFSEVTWAARADFSLSLPQTGLSEAQIPQPSLGDFLWQIYQGISSFLLPSALAEEVLPYQQENKTMPVLDPNSYKDWQKPAQAVVLPENPENTHKDTVNDTVKPAENPVLEVNSGDNRVLHPQQDSPQGKTAIPVHKNSSLPVEAQQQNPTGSSLAEPVTSAQIKNNSHNQVGFISTEQTQLPGKTEAITLHTTDPPQVDYNSLYHSLQNSLQNLENINASQINLLYTRENLENKDKIIINQILVNLQSGKVDTLLKELRALVDSGLLINSSIKILTLLAQQEGKSAVIEDIARKILLLDLLSDSLNIQQGEVYTSMFSFQKAAGSLGIQLEGVKLDPNELIKSTNAGPRVIHLKGGRFGQGHFVIVASVNKGFVTYKDIDDHLHRLSLEEFPEYYTGYGLTTPSGIGQPLTPLEMQNIWGAVAAGYDAPEDEVTTGDPGQGSGIDFTDVDNNPDTPSGAETPSTETPSIETPSTETPSTEIPSTETPYDFADLTAADLDAAVAATAAATAVAPAAPAPVAAPAPSPAAPAPATNPGAGGSTSAQTSDGKTVGVGPSGAVWSYDPATQSWSVFSASIPPELNTLPASEAKVAAEKVAQQATANGDTATAKAATFAAKAAAVAIQAAAPANPPAITIAPVRVPSVVGGGGGGGGGGGSWYTPPRQNPVPPSQPVIPPPVIPPTPPAQPVFSKIPETIIEDNIELSWTAQDAQSYTLEVSTGPDFLPANTTTFTGLTEPKKKLENLDKAQTYYVRVKAIKNGLEGAWSEVESFKKTSAPSTKPITAELLKELAKADTQKPVSQNAAIPAISGNSGILKNAQVDPFTGSGRFLFPIAVPPGRNGVQPNLNLIYSSDSGNSWLGTGWSLSGLGSIDRSIKKGVPKYDSSDQFLIQGKELVNIGNNEYRPKIESDFIKIVFSSNSWQVTNKSGIKFFFGSSANSRIETAKGAYSWALDKVVDLNGNSLNISYTKSEGQLYPQEIRYTANEQTNLLAKYKVAFTYETRPDISISYLIGEEIKTSRRLKTIEIFFEDKLVRSYELEYTLNSSDSRSLLSQINESGLDGQTSLPPVTFTYPSHTGGWSGDQAQWHTPDGDFIKSGQDRGRRLYDLNGDGMADFLISLHDPDESANRQWLRATHLGSKVGFSASPNWWPVPLGFFAYGIGGGSFWDDGRRLVDLTGDGLPEFLAATLWNPYSGSSGQYKDGYVFVYDKWVRDTRWNLPEGYFVYGNKIDGGLRFADLNGDGLNDLSIAVDEIHWSGRQLDVVPRTIATYINTGNGWQNDARWNSPDGYYITASGDGGRRLIDINGDGLVDFLVADGSSKATYLNTGSGWTKNDAFNIPDGNFSEGGLDQGRILVDINRDGLNDLLIAKAGYKATYLNTGSGYKRDDSFNLPDGDFVDAQGRNQGRYLADLDGDGLIDLSIAKDGYKKAHLNLGGPTHLLSKVANGLGGEVSIEYTPSTSYYNYLPNMTGRLPFAVPVSKTTLSDGAENSFTTNYSYKDGLYDAKEREFRGFGYSKITDAKGNYTENYFKQDDIYKGTLYRQDTRDAAGKLYTKAENTYQHKELFPQVNFVYLAEANSFTYDGDFTFKQTRSQFEYDSYGNPIQTIFAGDVSIIGDEKTMVNEYAYNPAAWIVSLPKYTAVLDGQGKIVGQKWFYYDGKGLLTKEEAWLYEPLSKTEERIPTTYTYDTFGNLISSADALGRTTAIEYDTTVFAYPIKITNALGQSLKKTYDFKTGNILTSTDPNGQTTNYIYDVLGRLLKVIGPNDTDGSPGIIYEYDLSHRPTRITKKVKADEDNYLVSHSFYDELGRLIQTKSPASDDPETGKPRQIVSGRMSFDSRGNVQEKYSSYYTLDVNDKPDAGDLSSIPKFSFEYDPLGRLIKREHPDGTSTSTIYSDWQITYLDENNHKQEKFFDAYGRVIQVKEYNQGAIYTTKYQYDAQGNLIKLTDNQGNTTQIWYDSFGRKIMMDDPDMGVWTYEYDAVGNLIRQTDAKGQVLTFEYDSLNRLTRKQGLSPSGLSGTQPQGTVPITLAIYIYDDPNKPNSVGRLSKVIDASGSTEFFYDNLGREIKSVKGLSPLAPSQAGQGTVPEVFTVERTYDALDRLTSLTYPDGEVIGYEYNSIGQLHKVYSKGLSPPELSQSSSKGTVPYIINIDYSSSGQLLKIEYGNGTTTYYRYHPNTSQLALAVTMNEKNNEVLQELRYAYDSSDNIAKIEDKVKDSLETFQYDDLNRLIKAAGEYGTLNYKYDSIGNLLEKEGTSYKYGAKPHAATQFGNTTLTYDANGNMISKGLSPEGGLSLTYDIENRLTEVKEGATITSFTYDGDGGRVRKTTKGLSPQGTVPEESTTYIGSLFEKDSDGTTRKHIFAGSNRVATIEGTVPADSLTSGSKGTVPKISYYRSDHLGSSSVITDSSGKVRQQIAYTPYGSIASNATTPEPQNPITHLFTGKELDSTGLYFYGARYYDPGIGRFITADTIIQAPYDPQSLNRYSYVRNNPVNLIDPTGNFWFIPLIIGAIKGAIVGSLIGGAVAAATGGNIGQGFLSGAISGAAFGAVGGLGLAPGISTVIGHTIAGAASGAINAAIFGGNVGMGALVGGLSAGAAEVLGTYVPFLGSVGGSGIGAFTRNLLARSAIGAIVGGGVSAAFGGSFGRGAAQGATAAAIAYTANHALHWVEEKAKNALNTDKSKETVIATGNKDLATRQERKIFLGKEPIDPNIQFLSAFGKVAGIATGTPTFSIIQVKYRYEMQEEWATFNLKWRVENGDFQLIEKTQIHGTEYWKHSYYYKETVYEPSGMPPNYRFDR